LAGVGTTTVSRAINTPDKVARKTLERVNQAIAATGYVPNLLAGGLASRKTRLIAAIVPSIANAVYAQTIQTFTQQIKASGYQVLLGETDHDPQTEEELVAAVLSRRPDAVLLTGIQHSAKCRRQLLSADIPIIEIWDITPTPLDVVVGFSHTAVGRTVAQYLFGKGYRFFGYASVGDPRAVIRDEAFRRELNRLGIEKVHIALRQTSSSIAVGRQLLPELLAQTDKRPMAVFCSSDIIAHGLLIEAQARGIDVPGELAIVGFGDQNFAAHTFPALTTVKIDFQQIGRTSAERLLARLGNQTIPNHVNDVGFEILERETA
jgi:LacI family gluconate utilization system Gnt-I transcriptional repressor